jgi:gliding motility-associated-like protein
MKNYYKLVNLSKIQMLLTILFSVSFVIFFGKSTRAQFTSTWALTSDKTSALAGVQAPLVIAGDMVPGAAFVASGAHNTDGYRCQITTTPWVNTPTDGYHLDFPLSPNGAYDLTINGLTLTAKTSGGSGNHIVSVAYQVDGAGPWISFGTAQTANSGGTTNISFGTLSTVLTNSHTYIIRMYVYAEGTTTTSSRKVYIKNVVFSGTGVPGGPAPTVQTTAASSTGRTSGSASGNITDGGISGVSVSGFAWGTAVNPTTALTTISTNGPTSGTYTQPITGLTAGTTYHVRAYATNAVGTSYGDDLTFTTDPAVIPSLTTTAASNITIFTANSGGNITDDGGSAITTSGVCWSTSVNPTIANSVTTNGTASGSYVSSLTGLLPSTTYYVRAYATNTVGTGYGNEISFTTPAPVPTLFANPTVLDFGNVLQNTYSVAQSYSLTGFYLNPASSNITVAAPAGFRVSLNSAGPFYPTLQVPYTNGSLAATNVYVKFSPTQVRAYDDSVDNIITGATTVYVRVKGVGLPSGLQTGQGFSNKGKEFWVGYSPTEKFYSDNSQDLRFTFSNTNNVPAIVTISMPNIPTFTPLTYTVPANSSVTTNANEIPESGAEDARLVNEGVYTSGIKISSDTPIVVYTHAITNQVYAATVLFPTPTLGKEYTSLNFTQRSNNSNGKSFLFVVATEDNTTIEVTLPAGVETDTHAAGSTFTQLLNKGEILNLFGKAIGHPNLYTGNDLTGTVVKSISTTSSCKPFAMYSGSSKITIDCDNGSSGSGDNLFQQMFPKQAWGTKVVTIPTLPLTKNHYRILVGDPATVVKRNGVTLTGLINNKYYEYFNDLETVDVLEADKPIMVAQYMSTNGECNNPDNIGDPDMVYLSSLQQTIDTVNFVSSPLGNTNSRTHYLNVAIPTAAASSFQLDGVSYGAAFVPTSYDPTTSYAQITVSEGFHNITASQGFNATAYGVAGDESYAYNAGTNVKNLLTGFSLQNLYGTGTASNACRNNEFYVYATLSYLPVSITWNFNNNPSLTPNSSFTVNNPVPVDSFSVNNQWLYVFQNPTQYLYNQVGLLPVEVTAVSPIPDGCNGEQKFTYNVNVIQGPTASFSYSNTSGCLNPPIQFTDNSVGNGLNLDLWQWSFGDAGSGANNTSILQSPEHAFSTGGTFNVTQHVVTLEGCYDDSTITINLSAQPVAGFTAAASACQGQSVTYTNTSTIASGNISQWVWDFGDATPIVTATDGNAQTHTYTNTGNYTVTLTVTSSTGCASSSFTQSITVNALPTVSFASLTGVCTNTAPFALTGGSPASSAGVGTGVYSGTGVSNGTFNPSTAGAGTFTITYTYTTDAGCVGTATSTIVVTQALNLTVQAVNDLCIGDAAVQLVPSTTGGVFTGTGVSGNSFDPAVSGIGTFTVNYSIPGNDCSVPTSIQITVNPLPVVDAGSPVAILNGSSTTLTATADAGTYLWSPSTGLSSTSSLTPVANPSSTTEYTLTVTNSFGCKASDNVIVTVNGPCLDPSNVFTPNGDGFYDKWIVYKGTCVTKAIVDVYNRWGGLVYHSDNYRNDWDGTSKNKPLPDATYYYVIKAYLTGNSQQIVKGNVTIMR